MGVAPGVFCYGATIRPRSRASPPLDKMRQQHTHPPFISTPPPPAVTRDTPPAPPSAPPPTHHPIAPTTLRPQQPHPHHSPLPLSQGQPKVTSPATHPAPASSLTSSTPSSRLQLMRPGRLTPGPYLYVQPNKAGSASPHPGPSALPTSRQLGNTTLAPSCSLLPRLQLIQPKSFRLSILETCRNSHGSVEIDTPPTHRL